MSKRRPICSPTTPEDRAAVEQFTTYLRARRVVERYEDTDEFGMRAAFTRLQADVDRLLACVATAELDRDQAHAALDRARAECDAIDGEATGHDEDDDAARETTARIRAAIEEPTR